jgi:dipeptidyl aminopeptidase/acylaminoacyl peptidase
MKILLSSTVLALLVLFFPIPSTASVAPETVSFQSGAITLHGLLYKPEGNGPFPAMLYNHGSAPGMLSNEAFEAIAPVYVSRGWVFFAPYRRGQGLSASAGPFIGSEIDAARKDSLKRSLVIFATTFTALTAGLLLFTRKRRVWIRIVGIAVLAVLTAGAVYFSRTRVAAAEMVRLLETDQLNDQLAAYDWLRMQDFVQTERIAVAGNSFGGVETVLGAERLKYCAAIDAAGGAESWAAAPQLQSRMIAAVRNSQTPIFFFQAANDYDLGPSRILSAAMNDAGKTAEVRIYPAFGKSTADGHSFAWLGTSKWAEDVFGFLDDYCGN